MIESLDSSSILQILFSSRSYSDLTRFLPGLRHHQIFKRSVV
jgi:hypothetical protein